MRAPGWKAVIAAGLAAAAASALAQLILWALFTDALPGIFYRDVRLTAALLMGPEVLTRPDRFDALLTLVAGAVHLALSLAYAWILAWALARLTPAQGLAAGAAFGAALFVVNLYGFTAIFPWFAVARDWITFAAHLVFGMSAAAAYKRFEPRGR